MVQDYRNENFREPDEVRPAEKKPEARPGKKKKRGFFGRLLPGKIKKNYMVIISVLLIVALILSRTIDDIKSIFFEPERVEEEVTEFMDLVPVSVYQVKRMDFRDTLPVMGRIRGYREIDLMFQTQGVLESFNFREGERILRGDIIASLDQSEALLKLQYASLELEKAKKMYELGAVAKLAVDQKQLEYESARVDLQKTNIYARTDGYLGTAEKDAGTYVTPQDKIGVFVDFNEVWGTFDVIEEDSSKMKVGQNVEVFIDAYPGEAFVGTVDTISPMIEGRTRSQRVRVSLDNERGYLKSGMFARAVINAYEQADAIIIPSSAFKREQNQHYVYVVNPQEEETPDDEMDLDDEFAPPEEQLPAGVDIGIIEKRLIEIEYLTHEAAEIGRGLEEGEMIIREIHQDFEEGDRVEIAEIQETLF